MDVRRHKRSVHHSSVSVSRMKGWKVGTGARVRVNRVWFRVEERRRDRRVAFKFGPGTQEDESEREGGVI
jgi:hypothetical protein